MRQARPGALNLLAHSLVHVKKAIDLIEQKDEKYDHLSDEDKATLVAKTTEIDQVNAALLIFFLSSISTANSIQNTFIIVKLIN